MSDDSTHSENFIDTCIAVRSPTSTPRAKEQSKLSDRLQRILSVNYPSYSFEYFPPKNKEGSINLTQRIRRMSGETQPLWVDITHSKLSKTIELAELLLDYTTVDIMVHLSMTNMTKKDLRTFLNRCKDIGIRNILAIRGDPPRGYDSWVAADDDLQHCADLVRFIRTHYDDYFSIFVGAYPEGHHNADTLAQDIEYLKQKVDAGADAIITQLFYDTKIFFKFIEQCKLNGINVPIIPGLMPMQTYATFVRIVSFTNIAVPSHIWKELEPIKHNDEKVKEYGIEYCTKMCKEILDAGINTLHFYTFNLERSVTAITDKLNLYYSRNDRKNSNSMLRSQSCMSLRSFRETNKLELDISQDFPNTDFPWDNSKGGYLRRTQESVRPIFWANRQESYLHRTAHWDEFPNGRWGDSRSPAYGEFLDHHLFRQTKLTVECRLEIWGEATALATISDVCRVFVSYLNGTIEQLPWCNQKIGQETLTFLLEPLKVLNSRRFLTINSQPQVNGAPSTDPVIGWGNNNGYVYQKAYLEFFCSKENTERLLRIIDSDEASTLTYQAINIDGKLRSNVASLNSVNAVTWGVFANCEILQPTVVDPQSFIAWKDEAFSLWGTMWQSIYDKESASYALIEDIRKNWFLVNIVENDYIRGNIFRPFVKLLHDDKDATHIQNVFDAAVESQSKLWSCIPWTKKNVESKPNPQNPYVDESLLFKQSNKTTDL
eukprot:261604_1